MAGFRLSPVAEQDITAILAWAQLHFGEQVRLRYEAPLVRAIQDVASNPRRAGCLSRPELTPNAFTYHLRFSRDQVPASIGRIRNPRHILLCRIVTDSCLEIARVLHHSMDLSRNLPEDHQAGP